MDITPGMIVNLMHPHACHKCLYLYEVLSEAKHKCPKCGYIQHCTRPKDVPELCECEVEGCTNEPICIICVGAFGEAEYRCSEHFPGP